MSQNNKPSRFDEIKAQGKIINDISPSFCTAKWIQTTIYLHNGYTHSCYHPKAHKIKESEIKKDPSALHNTSKKKESRKQMLNGDRPKECDYCWNIEDLGKDYISDRIYKSTNPQWSLPYLEKIKNTHYKDSIDPSYVEVSFSSTCNFACAYCSPTTSSRWMDEVKKYGPYPTSTSTGDLNYLELNQEMPIPIKAHNPYMDAFWEWWPSLYKSLNTFRITGGEPLLTPHTWKILDYVIENPNLNLNLSINSNLGVPEKVYEKFLTYVEKLEGKVASFCLFTSCESHGPQAEYARYGLDYEKFKSNMGQFLERAPKAFKMSLTITCNVLSLTTFQKFLDDVLDLREKYNEASSFNRIPIMINYLRTPNFLSIKILPNEIKSQFMLPLIQYMAHQTEKIGGITSKRRFYLVELDQAKRLYDFVMAPSDTSQLKVQKSDFKKFIEEYDKRKNLNFKEVFPELVEFLETC